MVLCILAGNFWSPHFCGSYAPWNLENIRKSTSNLSFLCQFFINEITASDAGPDIIRAHLFIYDFIFWINRPIHFLFTVQLHNTMNGCPNTPCDFNSHLKLLMSLCRPIWHYELLCYRTILINKMCWYMNLTI